jgi:hypothetical protein
MWIAILIGVGAGLFVAMFIIARQEKHYRMLFSDTHLADLVNAVEAARTGAPTTTFEGISVSWERMPQHCAVTLDSKGALASPAARFLLAFVCELVGEPGAQGLQLAKRRVAAVWPRAVGEAPLAKPEGEALTAMRVKAVDAMKGFAVVEGSLTAYR